MNYLMMAMGSMVFFGSLWGGTYFLHGATGEWYLFPLAMTAVYAALGGILLFASGVARAVCE